MTFPEMRLIHKDQRGMTLIELLVALALVGIITGGITMTISQVLTINTRASNHMVAVRQVQQAGKEVSKDTLQAQNVTCAGSNGFPLTLAWEDWDGTDNVVVYNLQDMPSSADLKMVKRSHTIAGGSPTVTVVAQYVDDTIDPDTGKVKTNCDWDEGTRVLTFTVTATVGGQSETRVYQVEPRPD